uniref:Pleurocidin-like peptide AP3 n=1 Tax=Hippoglossoides platessoides TaxID=34817 RepID=Q7SZH2_9PLEU|nr:pleurocidin-like peptide AP3 [Hippoglossoides platessoides]
MKFTANFLMLFIFVLMFEPGECGWRTLLKKAEVKTVGKLALKHYLGKQPELDKRAIDDDPSIIVFD